MYAAVKSSARAIDNAHVWLAEARRGDMGVEDISIAQIREQLSLAVNRKMFCGRRISATFKNAPGGQVLGARMDYTHRLLGFDWPQTARRPKRRPRSRAKKRPHITGFLQGDDIIERVSASDAAPGDLPRKPVSFPAGSNGWLQSLACRGEVELTESVTELCDPRKRPRTPLDLFEKSP
ncbi:carbon-phosphorus lyase complex subunit PhnI [Leisingera methylohalidivorans]|uniref:Uncharacterized protein n=1 Tax=Leisingera methylohalidivorans DSM 14336 TaxID=999552 RepID=V9VVR1_9RHOB|nr:carbon-phosphorus lyase complex subunit PhnI [Leisingera methylohalidivorans]AHD02831.1 hypothetical protein METH_01985 [Leisingera methylohalidivorans DSM 14336]